MNAVQVQAFEPYIKKLDLPWEREFLFATPQAQRWYDPLPRHYSYELEWLNENVDFGKGEIFIDGGCHHGLYGVALYKGCEYIAIDLHHPNVDITRANCALNGIPISYSTVAIANQRGYVKCNDEPLGVLNDEGDSTVLAVRLSDIHPKPTIVKLDIEGAEFLVLPEALNECQTVNTWIVEIHQWAFESLGSKDIINPFLDYGFNIGWIDRYEDNPIYKPLEGIVEWKMQSTLLAVR